jgi:DNA-binding transcriptional LysR family regulator
METSLLLAFLEVARRGSITAAADALRYTQSAVSRKIAALEDEVGAPLFQRLPRRGVRLTDAGSALLPHAEAVLGRLDAARREVAALAELGAGQLRVGAFPTANAELVPRALSAFRAQHPKVSPLLVEGTSPRQLDRLDRGDLHLAVVSSDVRLPLTARRAELTHLLDEPMLVALPRAHRLATRRALRLSELAAESWIAGDETVQDPLRTLAPDLAQRGRIEFVAREWTAKQGLVAAGFGLTLVPALAAGTVRRGVALVALHGDDAPARAVYVATPKGVATPPVVDAFLPVLRRVVVELAREMRERGLRLPTRPSRPPRTQPPSRRSESPVSAATSRTSSTASGVMR